jgi:hypothetical protein
VNTRSFFLSALIAGVITALLGNLPLVNIINCLLCIWVWVGGITAILLYRRFQPGGPGLTTGEAIGLGALTGLIGAIVGVLVYLLTASLSAPLFEGMMRTFQVEGEMPMLTGMPAGTLGSAIIFLVFDLILYPIFAALGALITAKMIWKKQKTSI